MQKVLMPVLLIALAADIWMVVYASIRADRSRTASFTLMCIALLLYTLGYLLEVLAPDINAAKIALQVENLGIPLLCPLFALTGISLFRPDLRRKWQMPVVISYGFAMFLVVLFNDYHSLYYTNVDMVFDGTSHFVLLSRGPIYIVGEGVVIVCVALTCCILIMRFRKSPVKIRRQILVFGISSVIAFCANVLNFSGLLPPGLDPTPLSMTIGFLGFCLMLGQNGMMDVIVLARDNAIGSMDDAFIVLDKDLDFLYCNETAVSIFPQLAGFHGSEPISSVNGWYSKLTDPPKEKDLVFERGEGLKYHATVRKITENQRKYLGLSIVIRDITDEQKLIDQLEALATTDPLTGILNRRHFFTMAHRDLEIAKRHNYVCALISFDIDHFKRVNDTYGHAFGDEVLCSTVKVIKKQLRVYDIFGRIGGEEFVIFTRSPGRNSLVSFADRLRTLVEHNYIAGGDGKINCTASFGVTEIFPGDTLEDAMRLADMAMYKAKEGGRNRVEIIPEHSSIIRRQ